MSEVLCRLALPLSIESRQSGETGLCADDKVSNVHHDVGYENALTR